MAEGGNDGAWYCANRPQFDAEQGRNFCPPEGCPKGYCALDAGWKHGDPSPDRCTGAPIVDQAGEAAGYDLSKGERAYIGLSCGTFAFKWGPYPPQQVGQMLAEIGKRSQHCAFFTIEFGAPEDPLPEILAMMDDMLADEPVDRGQG